MTRFKILLILLFAFTFKSEINAKTGNTIHVITHNKETVVTNPSTGNKSYFRWGVFPKADVAIRKIIMHVKFACPDTMRCAEWDYSDRISINRHGGVKGDSQNYELSRMLTPYGGAFAKDWKFQWEVDVTDFSLLLRDSVEINYNHSGYEPNNDRGWAITIDFEIVKGIPAFEPVSINIIYDDHFSYGDSLASIENKLSPVSFAKAKDASFGRLRIIQTGHGMDEPDGCGEFCNKYRELWYDGKLTDTKQIWKKCGDNPLYPQAGTWIYDRANWCPGNLMQPDIYDLPLGSESKHTIDFTMQSYNSPKPSAVEVITAYLIQYKNHVSEYDISVEDIMVPSSKSVYKRINPSAANPQIIVRNSGSKDVHSMLIEYGNVYFKKKIYQWKGELPVNKTIEIKLPGSILTKSGDNNFGVTISKPNGKKDNYPSDNSMTVPFASTPVHDSILVFYLLTNNNPLQNFYCLKSDDGKVIIERSLGSLKAKTEYRDTFRLAAGAYQLALTDTAGDGLEFWYNKEGGRGIARIINRNGELIKSFESDCGSGWIYNFVIGQNADKVNPKESAVGLFPTRTSDCTTLDYFSNTSDDVIVRLVSDTDGKTLEEHQYLKLKEGVFNYDLRRYPKGRFYLKIIINGEEKFSKRIRLVNESE